jgi:hypothetical protein
MKKRGQITFFLIVGIVVLVIIILVVSLNNKNKINYKTDDITTVSIENYIELCTLEATTNALKYISYRGGYYNLEEPMTNYSILNTKYYYKDGIHVPLNNEVSNQISLYLENNLNEYCNLSVFDKEGYYIEVNNYEVSSIINQDGIIVSVNNPVKISYGDSDKTVSGINLMKKTRLKSLLDASNEFVLDYERYNKSFCVTCNIDTSEKYDVLFEISERDNDYQIKVIDGLAGNFEREYFIFALKRDV